MEGPHNSKGKQSHYPNRKRSKDDPATQSTQSSNKKKKESNKTKTLSNGKPKIADDKVMVDAKTSRLSKEIKNEGERKSSSPKSKEHCMSDQDDDDCLVGEVIPEKEAKRRFRWRFKKERNEDNEIKHHAQCHYSMARVDGVNYKLNDCVIVKGPEDHSDYTGKILEFFKAKDGEYFRCQWFYPAEETAIEKQSAIHDKRRVFYSTSTDDNFISSIVKKVTVIQLPPLLPGQKRDIIPPCDYYFDMSYDLSYTTFRKMQEPDVVVSTCNGNASQKVNKQEWTLLDLYSGCGAMSTGLCMGAKHSEVKLITRWAVDMNEYACTTLRHNHPETEVRNEKAENFLELIKYWQHISQKFCQAQDEVKTFECSEVKEADGGDEDLVEGEFEVETILAIRHNVDENYSNNKSGIQVLVHWKGYGDAENSWEPIENLEDGAEEKIKEFVKKGVSKKLLPLPGDVDVVCGGPPCQGVSGFNRYRNRDAPLEDPRNCQIIVYMDIVQFLKPRFILMENVVDILKFEGGILGRYALSRLVHMNYQAKLGIMAAGCYGIPQFRLRVFLFGATATENLPKYPLPTHNVVVRGYGPKAWERNVVAYDEEYQPTTIQDALVLSDAISDLPSITNDHDKDEMTFDKTNQHQNCIRMQNQGNNGCVLSTPSVSEKKEEGQLILYDHIPLRLKEDDYDRVCRIPKEKGANFRCLPGLIIQEDNTVALNPRLKRILLPSGKPLVPNYAINFCKGHSLKPFGRLWWDEIVPTVVTRAEPHNQIILHPNQDRVLSVRENARLQGFPDYYKLFGPVKEKYTQVGNAVAVPVAKALGFAIGSAIKNFVADNDLVMELPEGFTTG